MRHFTASQTAFLQDFLFEKLKDLKKTKVRQMLKFGSVRVNGRPVTWHRHPLKPGDRIEILGKNAAAGEKARSSLGLTIVHEDEDLLVAEKPAGLLTMGTESEKENTLYFALTEYARSKSKDGKGRIFIVHRLDRDASGLIVFAKNEAVKRVLQDRWELAEKKYYAVTEGVPEKSSGTVENYLREDDFKRVYAVPKGHPSAKRAVTHYRVLRESGNYALLEVTLGTGRKNQIRVHLAGLGCPIAGDTKYGAHSDPFRRLALHACFLSFPHPATDAPMNFRSGLPGPFKKIFPDTR